MKKLSICLLASMLVLFVTTNSFRTQSNFDVDDLQFANDEASSDVSDLSHFVYDPNANPALDCDTDFPQFVCLIRVDDSPTTPSIGAAPDVAATYDITLEEGEYIGSPD